jgi:hypothetical protein
MLSTERSLTARMDPSGRWMDMVHRRQPRKGWSRGKVRVLRAPQAGKVVCRSMMPAMRTEKPRRAAEKRRKIHCALDAGARGVTIDAIVNLDRFQA